IAHHSPKREQTKRDIAPPQGRAAYQYCLIAHSAPLPPGMSRNASSSRLHLLDALRGIAAIGVVLHHEAPLYGAPGLFPRAYLAVDFFFALSGFVIAHAYDRRMAEGLGFGGFMLRRFVRLHPIVPLATLIGALAWVFAPFPHAAHV
ncbi:hypothetical protein KXV42_008944, partial [Aspergillus fumigatus]